MRMGITGKGAGGDLLTAIVLGRDIAPPKEGIMAGLKDGFLGLKIMN